MRVAVLLLTLVARVSASAWSDISKLPNTAAGEVGESTLHGPELIYGGDVWNGDKTSLATQGVSYIAKSVITGKDSYYPPGLPQTLKTPYLVPDSTHPKLAFWYAPAPLARASK
jgi:hypothetical protein